MTLDKKVQKNPSRVLFPDHRQNGSAYTKPFQQALEGIFKIELRLIG